MQVYKECIFIFLPFLSCFQGGKVHVSNLDTVLEAMEVNLTEEELDHLKDLLSGEHCGKHVILNRG